MAFTYFIRINTEEKAKVVVAILHLDDFEKLDEFILFFKSS